MIESFLKHLRSEKRVSAHTVAAYRTDLTQLREFLLATYSSEDVALADYGMVRSWIVSLVERRIAPRSINRKIACMRTFFRYLLAQGKITKDPMLKINVLKVGKRLPAFVRENDMVNLLDNSAFPDTFAGIRDQLILEMFYATGIRLSELINLKEKSVDFENFTIRVLGKRNKERVIPYPRALKGIIEKYLAVRNREVAVQPHGNLFVRDNGAACYPVMVYKIVKKYLGQFTAAERQSPHILRHTYATHLLNRGADLKAVKDLLGHASLAATQVYTHNSMEKLKKVFEQAHPKA